MTEIWRRVLWEQRVRLPLVVLLLFAWGLLLVLIFTTADPRTRNLSDQPGNVLVAARILGLDPLAAWISLGQLHPVFLVGASFVAVGLGVRCVAGELEAGTLELTLARPVRRRAQLGAYLAVLAPGCVALALAYALGALAGVALFHPDVGRLSAAHLLLAAVNSALLLLAVGALAVLVSALSSERGRALAWALGLLITMYAGSFLLPLWSPLAPLARLSLFWYSSPGPTIQRGTVAWGDDLVLALFALLTLGGAAWWFGRRDLAS